MFRRELITCRTATVPVVLGSPSGLQLQIPNVVVLGRPSGDEYRTTLDDGNVAGEKALHGVTDTQAAGICWTTAASCEPVLVEIRTVLGQLFPCVSTDHGQQRRLGLVPSAPRRFSPAGSVSSSVSSPRSDI